MTTPKHVFNDYTGTIGEPTLASLAALRKLQRDCRQAEDPNVMYFLLDLRQRGEHVWSHNVQRHLGSDTISLADFTHAIHPRWQHLHHVSGLAFFRYVVDKLPGNHRSVDTYRVHVPLLTARGNYAWYLASSRPVTFTEAGNAVHYLRELRRISHYDHFVPPRPWFRLRRPESLLRASLGIPLDNQRIEASLLEGIPPSGLRLLNIYRELARRTETGWLIPDRDAVKDAAGMSSAAINKAIVRLMRSARGQLPAIATGSVADMVTFLNDLFGPPGKE